MSLQTTPLPRIETALLVGLSAFGLGALLLFHVSQFVP